MATISDTSTLSGASCSFQKPPRPVVWKHFRRKKRSAQCLLCKKVLSYNGGTTSNLILHLNKMHPLTVRVHKTEEETMETKQLSIRQFGKIHKGKLANRLCSVEMQKEITRTLTKWTSKDMRPISIVRDEGLRELLTFLEPNHRLPSTTHVSALIRKDFEDGKAAVKEQLCGNIVALTTDIWTSRATQSFATTTAHFLDKQWKLTTCVLETVHFPGHHTGILISKKIQALTQYDVSTSQVSAVVHDKAANAVLAGEY